MNKQKLEEDIKKRRTNPYFSNTYTPNTAIKCDEMAGLADIVRIVFKYNTSEKNSSCCANPVKYKNGIGKMVFWSCKSCGTDLGDIND